MSTLIPYRYRNQLTRPETTSFMDDFFRPFFGLDNFTSTFRFTRPTSNPSHAAAAF